MKTYAPPWGASHRLHASHARLRSLTPRPAALDSARAHGRNTEAGDDMDDARLQRFVDRCWDDEIVPTLVEYIKIPNKSPAFDPDWATHGYMDEAVSLLERWARGKIAGLAGAALEIV